MLGGLAGTTASGLLVGNFGLCVGLESNESGMARSEEFKDSSFVPEQGAFVAWLCASRLAGDASQTSVLLGGAVSWFGTLGSENSCAFGFGLLVLVLWGVSASSGN